MSASSFLAGATAVLLAFAAEAAELRVGAGTALDLGSGSVDLGCADLSVAGTMAAGSVGFGGARNLTIDASGVLNGETATLRLTGDWDNSAGGTFNAGTSTVQLEDGCAVVTTTIRGSTTFSNLTLQGAAKDPYETRPYQVEAGSTQTITGQLVIAGVPTAFLELGSTSPGSEATLDIQGTAAVDYVEIRDIHATPDPIVFGPHSEIGSNVANVTLCGDIDGNLAIDDADVNAARDHLMGRSVSGDITRCNVIGPVDPLESGADCEVDDVFVLRRQASGRPDDTGVACSP